MLFSSPTRFQKLLRKFPWSDHDFFQYAVKSFTRVWTLKFSNCAALASLLSGLSAYQEELGQAVGCGRQFDMAASAETSVFFLRYIYLLPPSLHCR